MNAPCVLSDAEMQRLLAETASRLAAALAENALLRAEIAGLRTFGRRAEATEDMQTAAEIIAAACAAHGATRAEVTSHRRFGYLIDCRRDIVRRIVAQTRLSTPQIGALLNRDHTSIISLAGRKGARRARTSKAS